MIDYYETKSQPITRVMVIQAYRKVKANRGSGGIDEMSWADLENDLSAQLYKLWNRLTSGSYIPMPVKEVEIEKRGGGKRKLGIPTIIDRIAQEVVKTPLERYADDIVVHCKTERQALYLLARIRERFENCKLSLHPTKTKIVNFRGISDKKYPRGLDFLGFTLKPFWCKTKNGLRLMVTSFMSRKSMSAVMEKFRKKQIHKWRKPIGVIAEMLNPIIRGVMNYYCKLWHAHTHYIWDQLNKRLLKWVMWEKGLYKWAAVRYLRTKHKQNRYLFEHWRLCIP